MWGFMSINIQSYLKNLHTLHCKKSGGHIPPNMFPTLCVMSHHDAGGGTLPLYGGIVPLDISVMSHHYEVGGTIPP